MTNQTFQNEEILAILRGVIDPELGSNIVDLGMVKGTSLKEGIATLKIALTTSGCPLRAQIQKDSIARVKSLPGVEKVTIEWSELSAEEKSQTMAVARKNIVDNPAATAIPNTARVLAIASGKGGVGKSSVTANLAVALSKKGMNIGIIDADIWGFSIPKLFGISGRLEASKNLNKDKSRPLIIPHTLPVGEGRIDLVSMGLLVEEENSALLWRGLMLNRAVQHFLEDVAWASDLDYILIDLPPGTGDVSMGLARMLPRTDMIIVTTPALAAQTVAARAVSMANKCYLRIAGVIENMSVFVDPSGQEHHLFGTGGGQALSTEANAPLLGSIPIDPRLSQGGDKGTPIAFGDTPTAEIFQSIATKIVEEASPPIEMAGCSARMLQAAEKALAAQD